MDKSLQALCDAVKKIIWQLKPQVNALSFLLLTGKDNQGKTTLLRQSQLQHFTVDAERCADIFYNQHGIIVELGESWLSQSKTLLQHTLKQLNRCHRSLKISGIILCVDINELLISEPQQFTEHIKMHGQLLQRFGTGLGYRIDTAVMFTKSDALAGFCDFFQYEHAANLSKPLGFSFHSTDQQGKLIDAFKQQFEQLIETLGQEVINKMHPARSSIRRTLIREFPLQLASLRIAIQTLIQNIPPHLFRLEALYFTSAEQGGVSLDCLNKKIQHEYALVVQDKFPQAVNYRAYFIEGALQAFQSQTKRHASLPALSNKWVVGLLTGTVGLSLFWLGQQHLKSAHLLDEASKELLMYEAMASQNNNNVAPALYHLAKASSSLEKITGNVVSPTIQDLKTRLRINTKHNLKDNFLPAILGELEQTMTDANQTQSSRYQALKTYLMLGDAQKYSEADVLLWFRQHAKNETAGQIKKKLALLKQVLRQPMQPIAINQQVVTDVRNYLNALPPSYLYYSLAKGYFPQETQAIAIEGFELADKELPAYFTKSGFQNIMKSLPEISAQLQTNNWVLARQDLGDLPSLLQQAYCYEYVAWWQNFMTRSTPLHFQDYQQGHNLAQVLLKSSSLNKIIDFIQQQTSPEFTDTNSLFNKEIASKFTSLSLLSHSAVHSLTKNIQELEKFVTTLSVVNDQGKTAFTLARARFMGDTLSNPLSALYNRSQQLPEPVSLWVKQVADDTWFILINDSRAYINQQWQQTVFLTYQSQIAAHYPFDATQAQDVALADFDQFFANRGVLNNFVEFYLKPFLDTSQSQWQLKELNSYVLPITPDTINELIRANVISNMFFAGQSDKSKIQFSLQKISLDPIVASLQLAIGEEKLYDDQNSDSFTNFTWPQSGAKLVLKSIEGEHYELDEPGPWAFFKILQKVNVLVDEQDSANLQILFEVNGNSGRYTLKTQNQVNPFIPGILNGFVLKDAIV